MAHRWAWTLPRGKLAAYGCSLGSNGIAGWKNAIKAAGTNPGMNQEKVLIVEDEENERTGLAELVSSWG